MGTRIIEIRRRGNTTNLPASVYADSKQKIGSCFTEQGAVYTGLTAAEITAYMPDIIATPSTDPMFQRDVKEWFKNLSIDVPTMGIKLEAGTDDSGVPIFTLDYVKYLFVKSHPQVAQDEADIKAKYNYRFYVYDANKQKVATFDTIELRKKAYKEFIKLDDKDKKIPMLIRLFGANPDKMDEKEQAIFLEDKANNDSANFFAKITDKNLELSSFVEECLTAKVLRKIGNAYYETDDKLGDNLDETLLYLKDAKNSSVLTTIKARLQAFNKEPKV